MCPYDILSFFLSLFQITLQIMWFTRLTQKSSSQIVLSHTHAVRRTLMMRNEKCTHTEIKLTRNKATFSIERKMIDAPYIIIIIILKFQLTDEEKPLFFCCLFLLREEKKKLINFSRRQKRVSTCSFFFLPLSTDHHSIWGKKKTVCLKISTFHNESYLDFIFYGAY